jgi:beta-1,4-N-acetylglucosaminyltransferase
MKLLLVSSHGGHLSELERLLPAFEGYPRAWATYIAQRTQKLAQSSSETFWLFPNIGTNPLRLLAALFWAWKVLRIERPKVIISTGAEIALPFFYLGKLFGARLIFIESWTRVDQPTRTGRLVYPITDLFLVQWPELLDRYGPRARYAGRIL